MIRGMEIIILLLPFFCDKFLILFSPDTTTMENKITVHIATEQNKKETFMFQIYIIKFP